MSGQFLFFWLMYFSLSGCLFWLVSGGAHCSAHPNGERGQVGVVWPWSPYRPYRYEELPRCVIVIGPVISDNAWGVRILWRLVEPEPGPGYINYLRCFTIARRRWRRPRNLWIFGNR